MKISSFRDLRVWQAGMKLVVDVHRLTERFPAAASPALAAEMQRAARAIPASIAEGHSLAYTREYLHKVAVAQGSLAELQTQLEIAQRLAYVTPAAAADLLDQTGSLSKQLHALRSALSARLSKSDPPAHEHV